MIIKFLFLLLYIPIILVGQHRDLPKKVQDTLNKNKPTILKIAQEWDTIKSTCGNVSVTQYDWLKDYYIKYGIERVDNAQNLKNFINKNNLDRIDVPQKYIYQYNPDVKKTNANSLVIAKKVASNNTKINLQEIQQLQTIATEFCFEDCHEDNIIKSGKVYIVDTGEESFITPINLASRELISFLEGVTRSVFKPTNLFIPPSVDTHTGARIYQRLETNSIDEQAAEWLQKKKYIYYAKHMIAQAVTVGFIYSAAYKYFTNN
jgi:hypothetical protein